MHGGVKFYRGASRAARAYVERDHSRADDYYLGEGTGVAERLTATPEGVKGAGTLTGDAYEQWVAGFDVETGKPKGRLRDDPNALRFVEVTVNGPKTWSIVAALHPEISAALDAAQDRAAEQIVAWVAEHATTRVGPRGLQVQVPVERIEAAVIRHYTSRAGDPHRHLHLQINARVFADGKWRGIHSVGIRDSIEAINGIGHAAVATDENFRRVLARHGYSLDPTTSEVRQLREFVPWFSARTRQIHRNIDRYEADWRGEHPGEEPGPKLREIWDRRAWADARPDKVTPISGADLVAHWNSELREAGFRPPTRPVRVERTLPAWINRDAAADLIVSELGATKSAWNGADIRGRVEILLAQTALMADAAVRVELAEDITARAVQRCERLLTSSDVPGHVRNLSSQRVLAVEADIVDRLAARGTMPARNTRLPGRGFVRIDPTQNVVAGTLAGTGRLVVVEGAAGAGKTTALRATQELLTRQGRRMLVVTPTLKAAEVAARETGANGHSAAWLIRQHGWRWDSDGHWTREPNPRPNEGAQLRPGDLVLVDEAGMLDQDTARALLTIADETGARVAFVGDRHQLPAVGRGGVFDHAIAYAHTSAVVTLENVHRFSDPAYRDLSLRMRKGTDPGAVFDALLERGQIVIHPSDVERTAALAEVGARGDLVIANTGEQVSDLNDVIRAQRLEQRPQPSQATVTTGRGEIIGLGDRVATRRNDPTLGVTNRQTWTVAGVNGFGGLVLSGGGREREVPADYVSEFIELAYATTVHGAQGETVQHAHALIGDSTGAAAAYVAMTRGRESNVAHLVADSPDEARKQWIGVFARDRADLGPAHARTRAIEDITTYGPMAQPRVRRPLPPPPSPSPTPSQSPGIGF